MTFVFIELMVNFFREIILTLLKAETVGEAGQKSLGKFSAAIGRWRKAVAAVAPKRRYGAPRRRKDYRSPRRFARFQAAGESARFWSAPVLWRFGSGIGLATGESSSQVYARSAKSGRGLPQSKTLRENRS